MFKLSDKYSSHQPNNSADHIHRSGNVHKIRATSFSSGKPIVLDWRVGINLTFLSHYTLGVSYNIPLGETIVFDSDYVKNVKNKLKYWMVTVGYQF